MSVPAERQWFKPRLVIPLFVLLAVIMALFQGIWHRRHARSQASVNEGQETALIYVDAAQGSDSNPGTAALPLKTISAAASIATQNNQNGVGTRVTINPGTYRESIALSSNSKTTSSPVTFQAATNGTVIVSGADVWTGWQTYGSNPQIYTNSWPYQWGFCTPMSSGPFEQGIVLRREMIFVNGTPLTQVLSSAQMVEGTFFVDETGRAVYIWPAAGTNVATAAIEVATRSGLFSAKGRSNIVLRGLTFQYDNSCKTNPAVSFAGSGSNILIDTDTFLWNNAQGLNLSHPLTNVTVQNAVSNHNGESGFQAYEMTNVLWQSDQASYNNWRGAQGALYGWNTGGAHLYYDHAETVNSFTALFNTSHGIHWDTGAENVNVSSMVAVNNLLNGAFIEAGEGPVTVSGSQFCGNTNFGVEVKDSPSVTLSGNNFYNNVASQIGIGGVPGGENITDWATSATSDLITQNLTLTGNAVEGLGGQYLFSNSYLGGSDWSSFLSTLSSNNNTWWHPSNSTPFVIPAPNNGTVQTFAQWQSTTGQDLNSTFAEPPGQPPAACQVSPDAPDYWLTVDSPSLTASGAGGGTYNFTVVPLSWSGTVNLTVDGASEVAGLGATLGSPSLNISGGNSATTTLTLADTTSTPPGTYPITVIANSGSLTHTVTVSLVVPVTSVRLSTGSLSFSNQQIKTTSPAQTVTLSNIGSATLTVSSIATGNNFGETNNCGTSLRAGASCTVSVTFTPASAASLTGTLTITDSDASSPQTVSLTGTGTAAPTATLSTHSLSYGNQVVGTTSAPQTATLTNTGTGALSISNVSITGTNPSYFSQSNNCGSSLAAGATCTFTVTFTPSTTGSMSATLTITDNVSSGSQTVNLSGTGATGVSLSRSSLTFSSRTVGTTSSVQTFTLTNSGNKLTIQSISLTGTNPGDFAQTNNCGTSVAAGANCTINLTFTPTASGTRSASVTIADSDPTSPQSVSLSGTGTTSAATTFSSQSLSFGSQVVGTSSAPLTAKLTNSGTGALSISKIAITGTNPSYFTQTNNCGSSLAAGASCTFTVTFTPATTGSMSAAVTITDNAASGSQTINLSGNGATAVSLSQSSINFSSHAVGTTSGTQTITLTNLGNKLTISGISITGTNPGDFAQTNNCGTSVAAGGSCTISATFTAAASGTRSASVTISDSDPMTPQSVSLSGTGTTSPATTFSTQSLSFGSQVVGTSSAPLTATLTNSGTGALSISNVAVTGANPSYFTQTNNCGSSLAAGALCTFTVTFTPSTTSSVSAAVTITDNAASGSQTINLNGNGKSAVSLSRSSINFSSHAVGTTSGTQTITLTNLGNKLTVSGISITGTNSGDFAQTNNCGSSVPAGGSCTINATFTATTTGARSAAVTISDSDPTSPQSVSLSGTGT